VATTGTPGATGRVLPDKDAPEDIRQKMLNEELTVAKLFWRTFNSKNYILPSSDDFDKCFMFEIACMENMNIVKYSEDILQLHGVRNLTSLNEEEPEPYAEKYHWDMVPIQRDITTVEQAIEVSKSLNGIEAEGFVVVDCEYNRFKIKSPMYVELSLLSSKDKNQLNRRRLLGVIKINEDREFLAYFPQYTDMYNKLREQYDAIVTRLQSIALEVENINDSKQLSNILEEKGLNQNEKKCIYWVQKNKKTVKYYFRDRSTKFLENTFFNE